jgi:hypothetical protein
MGLLELSQQQAIDFIELHPKKKLQELVNLYYDTKF